MLFIWPFPVYAVHNKTDPSAMHQTSPWLRVHLFDSGRHSEERSFGWRSGNKAIRALVFMRCVAFSLRSTKHQITADCFGGIRLRRGGLARAAKPILSDACLVSSDTALPYWIITCRLGAGRLMLLPVNSRISPSSVGQHSGGLWETGGGGKRSVGWRETTSPAC